MLLHRRAFVIPLCDGRLCLQFPLNELLTAVECDEAIRESSRRRIDSIEAGSAIRSVPSGVSTSAAQFDRVFSCATTFMPPAPSEGGQLRLLKPGWPIRGLPRFLPQLGDWGANGTDKLGIRLDSTTPLETAYRVKVAMLCMFSVFMRSCRCFSTVFMLRDSTPAICLVA